MKIYIALLLIALVGCTTTGNVIKDTQEDTKMTIVFETNKGNFEVELFEDKAPISTQNFLDYVQEGYYDGLIFHRVIDGFMVQGGGFDTELKQKTPKPPIKNEADNGLKNEKYTLAMARTAVVDSATSQFFINTADNAFLDNGARDFGYAVFGKVISGFDVVDAIEKVQTENVGSFQDVPKERIIMEKVYVK